MLNGNLRGLVTIVGGIETYGDAIAIQQISHKKNLPIDYRTVQGALYADGSGNLLSGIFGTVPNTTCSTSISVVDMTGVGARKVRIFCGLFIMVLALTPGKKAVLKTRLSTDSLPEANIFIRQFSRQNRWSDRVCNRLQLVVEETLLSLIQIRKTSIPG